MSGCVFFLTWPSHQTVASKILLGCTVCLSYRWIPSVVFIHVQFFYDTHTDALFIKVYNSHYFLYHSKGMAIFLEMLHKFWGGTVIYKRKLMFCKSLSETSSSPVNICLTAIQTCKSVHTSGEVFVIIVVSFFLGFRYFSTPGVNRYW